MRLFLIFALTAMSMFGQANADPLASQATASPPSSKIDRHLAKILASGDGRTAETAYKVKSLDDEYEILRSLNLRPQSQSLVIQKKAYDLFSATDMTTGETREIWFDINSFYGRMF